MNNKEFFQSTFSKVTVSDEKKQRLIHMTEGASTGRRIRMLKPAAAVALCVLLLAGGGAAHAISNGKIFNSVGHFLRTLVMVNGEKQDVQVTTKKNGDFVITYEQGTKGTDDWYRYETTVDGDKDTTMLELNTEFSVDGQTISSGHEIKIDGESPYEEQLWQIREQMLPIFSKEELTDAYISALTGTMKKLSGVWKEGIRLSIQDIKTLKSGRLISIQHYDYDDGKDTSWLYIDYTDVRSKNGNGTFTVKSQYGSIDDFEVKVENYEVRSWRPLKQK